MKSWHLYRVFLAAVLSFALVSCGIRVSKIDRLVDASRRGDGGAIRALVSSGADINGSERGMLGQTPLVASTALDDTNTFYLLLQLGADVNAPATDGITPLMEAVVVGDANSLKVKELIRRGANVNARDFAGNSVLAHARASGCQTVLHDLLNAGAKD